MTDLDKWIMQLADAITERRVDRALKRLRDAETPIRLVVGNAIQKPQREVATDAND